MVLSLSMKKLPSVIWGSGGGWQPDRAQKIGLVRELLPQACVLLIERVMGGHHNQDAARLEHIEGLGQKEVMQGEAAAGILEFEVCEGHVANHGIDTALRQ